MFCRCYGWGYFDGICGIEAAFLKGVDDYSSDEKIDRDETYSSLQDHWIVPGLLKANLQQTSMRKYFEDLHQSFPR